MKPLSPTEQQILRALERGCTYKSAAAELGISVNTLKTHAQRILTKTLAASMLHASWLRRAQSESPRRS